jgi:hypothetical protein
MWRSRLELQLASVGMGVKGDGGTPRHAAAGKHSGIHVAAQDAAALKLQCMDMYVPANTALRKVTARAAGDAALYGHRSQAAVGLRSDVVGVVPTVARPRPSSLPARHLHGKAAVALRTG